jgi:hypothetical protein
MIDATANTVNIPLINVLAGGSGTTPGGRSVIAPSYITITNNPRLYAGANCSGIYLESILYAIVSNNIIRAVGNVNSGVYGGNIWWAINVYTGYQTNINGNAIHGFLWGVFPRRDTINAFGNGSSICNNSFTACALGLSLLNCGAISAVGNMYYNCVKPVVIGQGGSSNISLAITYVGNNAVGCTYNQPITGINTVNYTGTSTIAIANGVTVAIVPLYVFTDRNHVNLHRRRNINSYRSGSITSNFYIW